MLAGATNSELVFRVFRAQLAAAGLAPGARLAVALSGGPDSVALASLVSRWGQYPGK